MVSTKFNWGIPYGKQDDSNSYEIELLKEQITNLERKVNNLRPPEKLYLTIEETMELCRIKSPSTLWNWKQQGLLVPKARAGRTPLYLREDVLNFLNGKEAQND